MARQLKLLCAISAHVSILWFNPAFALSDSVTQTNTPSSGRITRYETQGNLEVTNDLPCIAIDQVKNTYTPADLYRASAKCVNDRKYEEAVDLFIVAGSYGYFDKLRVADKSAHQAVSVLIMNNMGSLSEEQKTQWKIRLDSRSKQGSTELADICQQIRKIGAPEYYPAYMIQHGIKAFTKDSAKPILDNFDVQQAWGSTMTQYLHCTV